MHLIGFYTPSPIELIVVGILALIIFGKKLPSAARNLGSSFNQFKRGLKDDSDANGYLNNNDKPTDSTQQSDQQQNSTGTPS